MYFEPNNTQIEVFKYLGTTHNAALSRCAQAQSGGRRSPGAYLNALLGAIATDW